MSWQKQLFLILAMIAGVGFALLLKKGFYDNKPVEMTEEEQKLASEPQIPVMVAKGDLQAGQELTAQNIRFQRFPESQVPWNAIFLFRDVIGRRLVHSVPKDRLIGLGDLTSPDEGKQDTMTFIPPGYQAVNIEIPAFNDSDSASLVQLQQRLRPQDRVSISVMYEDVQQEEADSSSRPAQRKLATRIVCQNVEVYQVSAVRKEAVAGGTTPAGKVAVLSLLMNESQNKELRDAAKIGHLIIVPERQKSIDSTAFSFDSPDPSRSFFGTSSLHNGNREADGLFGNVLTENLSPFGGGVSSPLGQNAPSPIEGSAVSPLGDSVVSPLGDSAVSPLDNSVVSPLDDSVLPVDDGEPVPVNDSSLLPLDDSAVSPLDEAQDDSTAVTPAEDPAAAAPQPESVSDDCAADPPTGEEAAPAPESVPAADDAAPAPEPNGEDSGAEEEPAGGAQTEAEETIADDCFERPPLSVARAPRSQQRQEQEKPLATPALRRAGAAAVTSTTDSGLSPRPVARGVFAPRSNKAAAGPSSDPT